MFQPQNSGSCWTTCGGLNVSYKPFLSALWSSQGKHIQRAPENTLLRHSYHYLINYSYSTHAFVPVAHSVRVYQIHCRTAWSRYPSEAYYRNEEVRIPKSCLCCNENHKKSYCPTSALVSLLLEFITEMQKPRLAWPCSRHWEKLLWFCFLYSPEFTSQSVTFGIDDPINMPILWRVANLEAAKSNR